jgi:lipopolysaccharide export system permease protein
VNILDRYLLGRFVRALPLCMAASAALFLLVDFFLRIGEFAEYDSGVGKATAYFLFKLPRILTEIYPAASLLAVLIGVGALAEGREILAMKACGMRTARIVFPIVATATIFSGAMLAWNETVVPPASSRARMIQDIGIEKRLQSGVFNASSIWFQSEQGFVNIEFFDANHNALHNITLHVMDEAFRLVRLVEVPRATWNGSEWKLEQGSVTAFINDGDSVTRNTIEGDLRVDAKPDELRRKRRRAYEFSYKELSQQIGELERKGLDATEYLVDLNYKLAAPFAGLVAVVMAFPLAARSGKRGGGMLRNVGLGLAVSFAYWSATALSVAAGHSGTLPPILAAWAPNALFGLGGSALYLARDN